MTMDIEQLREMTADVKRALIVCHDYPDPDCLASAWGLSRLFGDRFGVESDITFGGFIGRAGNRAMVELLRIALVPILQVEYDHYDFVVMVDTQPGTGNNAYAGERPVDLVIDHHPSPEGEPPACTCILTECGSTTAIVADLLFTSGMDIDPHLATALFLGIKTDTLALGREFCNYDWEYYLKLFPMIDQRLLSRIEHPDLPPEYFRMLAGALEKTTVYGTAACTHLGSVRFPEAIAEYADILLHLENVEWVLTTGVFRDRLFFSIRMRNAAGSAGELARTIVKGLGTAGGHEEMAGGRTDVEAGDIDGVAEKLKKRFLRELDIDPTLAKPLC